MTSDAPPVPADPGQDTVSNPLLPAPVPLAGRAARGFVWLVGYTVSTKLVSFGGQMILARLLAPADFGVVGLAYTVVTFVSLIRDCGLGQILIRRQKRFHLWAGPVAWLSLSLGLLTGAVMVAVAPAAARFYHAPGIKPLLLVLAASAPVYSLTLVCEARLQAELRFGFLATVGTLLNVLTTGLTIAFAWAGLGPLSFVLPVLLVAVVRVAILWPATGVPLRRRPQVRRWRFLAADSGLLLAATVLLMLVGQGDYVTLGRLQDQHAVGIYFFAFNLSLQSMQMLTGNVGQVLLPALSRITEPASQARAFVRASKLIGMIGIPACFLLAALSGPLVRTFFGQRWVEAIPVLAMLAAGMGVASVGFLCASLLLAQRRYRDYLVTAAVSATLFFPLVIAGAKNYAAVGTAAAVMVHLISTSVITLRITLGPAGYGVRGVTALVARCCVPGAASVALGRAASFLVPPGRFQDVGRIGVTTIVGLVILLAGVRSLTPETWQEARARVLGLVPRRAPRGADGGGEAGRTA